MKTDFNDVWKPLPFLMDTSNTRTGAKNNREQSLNETSTDDVAANEVLNDFPPQVDS